jgi:tetratricopeptide (TPR) repeat protein
MEIRERLVAMEPDNLQYLHDLSIACFNMGSLTERTDPGRAREYFARALEIHERRVSIDGGSADTRERLGNIQARLAVLCRTMGLSGNAHYEAAMDAFAAAEALSPSNPGPRYARACIHALWGDVDKALDALRQAVDLGYRDAAWAEQDPDFEALRPLPAFQQILAQMRDGTTPG